MAEKNCCEQNNSIAVLGSELAIAWKRYCISVKRVQDDKLSSGYKHGTSKTPCRRPRPSTPAMKNIRIKNMFAMKNLSESVDGLRKSEAARKEVMRAW